MLLQSPGVKPNKAQPQVKLDDGIQAKSGCC
jgi:hypothetical protein